MSAPSYTSSVTRGRTVGRIVGGIAGGTVGLIAGAALSYIWYLFYFIGAFFAGIVFGVVGILVGILVGIVVGAGAENSRGIVGGIVGAILGGIGRGGGIVGGIVGLIAGAALSLIWYVVYYFVVEIAGNGGAVIAGIGGGVVGIVVGGIVGAILGGIGGGVFRGRIVGGVAGGIVGLIAGAALSSIWYVVYYFVAVDASIVGGVVGIGGIVGGVVGILVGIVVGARAENSRGIVGGIVGAILGGIYGGVVGIVGGVFFPFLVVVSGIVVGARLGKSLGGIVGRSGGFLRAIVGRIRSLPVTTWVFVGAMYSGVRGVTIKVWGIGSAIILGAIVGVGVIVWVIVARIRSVPVTTWVFVGAMYSGIRGVSVIVWLIVVAIFGGILGSGVTVWIIFGGTDGGVIPPPPFEGMDQPRADVALVIIGEIMAVSEIQETSSPDMRYQFCYYDATVAVERTMFGPTSTTVTIRQPQNSVSTSGGPGFISSKLRLREGDRILAFLSRDTSLFDLNEDQFVPRDVFWIEGQEVVKYVGSLYGGAYGGECIAGHGPLMYERKMQPLEEVVAWIEEYSQVVLSAGNVGVTPTPVYDYKSLIDDLRSAGASVEEHSSPTVEQSSFKPGSTLSQVALLGWGRRVSVNGETIHIYEYLDVLAADTEAGFVSPDGYNISVPLGRNSYSGSHYEWTGPPHFYKKGRVIVRYVEPGFGGFFIGDDPPLVEVLQRALGPQFAGSRIRIIEDSDK